MIWFIGTSPLRGSDDELNKSVVALTDDSSSSQKYGDTLIEPPICSDDSYVDETSRLDTSAISERISK